MSDAATPEEDAPKKPSKLPLIIGLVLALAGGGAGFYAAFSGMIPGLGGSAEAGDHGADGDHAGEADHDSPDSPLPDVAFVELPQIVVSLGEGSATDHLIFRADLEVPSAKAEEVRSILPRVIDVLNSYLRALEPTDVQGPSALIRLRGQMLRRIQLVTGEGRVRDLLVMEFVLN